MKRLKQIWRFIGRECRTLKMLETSWLKRWIFLHCINETVVLLLLVISFFQKKNRDYQMQCISLHNQTPEFKPNIYFSAGKSPIWTDWTQDFVHQGNRVLKENGFWNLNLGCYVTPLTRGGVNPFCCSHEWLSNLWALMIFCYRANCRSWKGWHPIESPSWMTTRRSCSSTGRLMWWNLGLVSTTLLERF